MRGGANVRYLAQRFPSSRFLGIDYDEDFLRLAHIEEPNAELVRGNWFAMDEKYIGAFDGIVSFQTLIAFEDYKKPIAALAALKPRFIALTSLFYEGRINFYTRIEDFERNDEGWGEDGNRYYNIYAFPLVQKYLAGLGYGDFRCKRCDIDLDLPKPATPRMQTYTIPTADGTRMQVSGAMLLPWYFIYAERTD